MIEANCRGVERLIFLINGSVKITESRNFETNQDREYARISCTVCQGRDTFIPTASRVFSFLLLSKQPFSFGFHGLFCNSLQVLEDVQ